MNKVEHLLTILSEECSEVSQVACKAIRFGMLDRNPGQLFSNARHLEKELADLVAVSEMLGLKIRAFDKREKKQRVKKYMEYSRSLGTLESAKEGNPHEDRRGRHGV